MISTPPAIVTTPYAAIASIGPGLSGLIARHIDLAFRGVLRGPGVVHEASFTRVITGQPHPFGNFALMSGAADESALRAAAAPLMTCPAPSAVIFSSEVSAPAAEFLASSGFQRHAGLPAMAIDIDSLSPTALPSDCTFVRVTGGQRAAWGEAFAAGYELPGPVGALFAAGLEDDPVRSPFQYFAAMRGGKPVSTSLVYFMDGVAGIYGVATLPHERGKGLGAHMTAEALRIARSLGYRVGVLQSSEAGYPVYKRLGFSDLGELALFVRIPS